MKARIRALVRGLTLGMDPSMAFRQSGPIIRYDGPDESLARDWRVIGQDIRRALNEYDSAGRVWRGHVSSVSSDDNDHEPSERRLSRRSDEYQAAEVGAVVDHKQVSTATPDGKPVALATQRRVSLTASAFSGPLPPPELFRQYEDICPGAADRILRMSEKEGDHRRALETRVADSAITTQNRAQIFGFIVVIATTLMGGTLLLLGVPAVGITMVIGSLVAIIGAGIWNKVEERKQRQLEERQLKVSEQKARAQENQQASQDNKKGKKK